MADFGDYSNNPLWTDITQLDHLSPSPGFGYQWNRESGRWEPDQSNLYLHGISGEVGRSNIWLEGISGVLSNIRIGVDVDSDSISHGLLSGISGALESIQGETLVSGNIDLSRSDTQPWKLVTKTVNQHIEEDFIMLECSDEQRFEDTGRYYGVSLDIMDDIYGTYWDNGRRNPSSPETGQFFLLTEVSEDRPKQRKYTFDTDAQYAFRPEDTYTTGRPLFVHPLTDYNDLYERGLAESVTIVNNSIYPLQIHSFSNHNVWQKDETEDRDQFRAFFLKDNQGVNIDNDESSKIYVKRPHVISGYDLEYTITYKSTGAHDVIR